MAVMRVTGTVYFLKRCLRLATGEHGKAEGKPSGNAARGPQGKTVRQARHPKKATPERLQKAALFYLERYASSSENLRRVLMRRVERSAQYHGTDRAEGVQIVASLIERFLDAGLLDDQTYADAKTASLHRRGASKRAIRLKLSQKGLDAAMVEKALEALQAEKDGGELNDDLDFVAAVNYARRRRLGPFRLEKAPEKQSRDLAALGRQGFSYDIARRIIEAETPEALQ